MKIKHDKVLIKISGEALSGKDGFGINDDAIKHLADEIKNIYDLGVKIAIVVGGGNFFRGRTGGDIDRATADYMGMLATVMNALALQDTFISKGIRAKAVTSIEIRDMAEGYSRRKVLDYLEDGQVVIFGGGTGSPFFSTDTTAALRACEIGCEVILMAKNIDAVYSDDPKKNPNAVRYKELTYMDLIEKELMVMDLTAVTMCKDNNIKIYVFGLSDDSGISRVIEGENPGTLIK